MITETGKDLSILIITETGRDWETFATWYSAYKNLPDARVCIACQRNGETPFQFFQWAKRLKLNFFTHSRFSDDAVLNWLDSIDKAQSRRMLGDNLLVIEPYVMFVDTLDPKLLSVLNLPFLEESVWYLPQPNIAKMMNEHSLNKTICPEPNFWCREANQTEELTSLVTCRKGCGKWLNTLKGCPFSSAAGLASETMTANENRIIELWKKMCSLYSALV